MSVCNRASWPQSIRIRGARSGATRMPDFENIDFSKLFGGKCRGVSYYEAPHPLPDCPKRILFSRPDGF